MRDSLRSRLPLALLVVATVLGGYLRFAHLGRLELSADEGASWAAAAAPTLGQVIRLQTRLNPGELGLHDAALHFWIGLFGDGLAALRSLSAVIGTMAILLVFLASREVLAIAVPESEASPPGAPPQPSVDVDLAAAVAAVIFAVNLVTIKYSRETRMYPFALALGLAQISLFARSLRDATARVCAGLAVVTMLAIAATFTMSVVLVPEGLYLLLLTAAPERDWRRIAAVGLAIIAGLLLIAPFALIEIHLRGGAPGGQAWAWIPAPSLDAPISFFSKATGSYAFPLLVILAAAGAARARRSQRWPVSFLLLWMLAPPIALTAFSYAVHPAFVERYLLVSFVPFFILAALGLLHLQPDALRPGALALVVALALAHVAAWDRKPHGAQLAEAAAAAATATAPGVAIGVAPPYAANAIRYYFRGDFPARTVAPADAKPSPGVVIILDSTDRSVAADLFRRFPRPLAQLDGVVVRGP